MKPALCHGIFLLSLALAGGPASAEAYRVGMADVLRLRVMEWQPVDGLVRDWPAMAGDYAVGSDGAVSVPFLGRVPVAGQTSEEIGATISAGLKQRFALPDAPDALVEIAHYRPVFVSGLVRSSGEFAYQPGLTVAQAISMAGGPADELGRSPYSVTSYLNAEGQLDLLLLEDMRLRLRLARLQAERDGKTEVALPEDVAASPRANEILGDEQQLLRLRRERLERELSAIASQDENLNREIEALQEKTGLMEKQAQAAQASLENVTSLVERGLAVQDRLNNAEIRFSNTQSQLLDLSTAILRARQSLVNLERDRLARIDTMAVELAQEHLATSGQIAENARRIETQQRILSSEIIFSAPQADGASPMEQAVITIIRQGAEGSETLPATMATALLPGDVIELRPPAR